MPEGAAVRELLRVGGDAGEYCAGQSCLRGGRPSMRKKNSGMTRTQLHIHKKIRSASEPEQGIVPGTRTGKGLWG